MTRTCVCLRLVFLIKSHSPRGSSFNAFITASYFFNDNRNAPSESFDIYAHSDTIYVRIENDFLESDTLYTDYMYYHIQNSDGSLDKYAVVDVTENIVLKIQSEILRKNKSLKVYYKGYSETFSLTKNNQYEK